MGGMGALGMRVKFNGDGGKFPGAPEAGGNSSNAFGGELWNDLAKMTPYDMVMLSCECSESNDNKGGDPGTPGARRIGRPAGVGRDHRGRDPARGPARGPRCSMPRTG